MRNAKRVAGTIAVGLAVAGTGTAVAASGGSAPAKATIKESQTLKFKPNRYVQDGLRWDKDVYRVKSGGTLHVVNNVATEGPHTFTVVKRTDLPRTAAQFARCGICEKLGKAHGVDPQQQGPPKFPYLEDGVGQDTVPDVDRPGDSAVTGEGKKGESVDLKVVAKRGTTLYFMCLVHPQMQGKVIVG